MRKAKILWSTVLVVSVILLIGYGFWSFNLYKSGAYKPYGSNYYGRGMMSRWLDYSYSQDNNGKKLSVDQIKANVNDYISGYNDNLEISDIFIYKNTDYYVSVKEKDTGKGAMELLVNPYSGQVYPEYGPNIMWNDKYSTDSGYSMMGNGWYNMMGEQGRYKNYNYNYNNNRTTTSQIGSDQAISIADQYVKTRLEKDFSVLGDGHEFYGYYTFYIKKGDNTVGMLSVNYYTGDVWYHDWHGELEEVVTNNK